MSLLVCVIWECNVLYTNILNTDIPLKNYPFFYIHSSYTTTPLFFYYQACSMTVPVSPIVWHLLFLPDPPSPTSLHAGTFIVHDTSVCMWVWCSNHIFITYLRYHCFPHIFLLSSLTYFILLYIFSNLHTHLIWFSYIHKFFYVLLINRVDLVWSPPGTEFDHLTVTGYKIIWFQPEFRTRVSNVTVGKRIYEWLLFWTKWYIYCSYCGYVTLAFLPASVTRERTLQLLHQFTYLYLFCYHYIFYSFSFL